MEGDDLTSPRYAAGSKNVGDFTDSVAWSAQAEVSASEIVEKQKLVRDIIAMQDGLKGLIAKSSSVKAESAKAASENEMLQQYIDSVTKSLAAKSN